MIRLAGALIRFLKADRVCLALEFLSVKTSLLTQEQDIV